MKAILPIVIQGKTKTWNRVKEGLNVFQFPRETKGKSITRKVPGGKEKKKKEQEESEPTY